MRKREIRVLEQILKYGWRVENRNGGAWTLWRWLVEKGIEKGTSKRSWYLAFDELKERGLIERYIGERGYVWYVTDEAMEVLRNGK